MARPRKINREQLLDAAEALVREQGAGALTIDALARRCGVTKGGVQYALGSKDDIIDAMFARWNESYDRVFAAEADPENDPVRTVWAHVSATRQSDDVSMAKAASLMAGLLQTPEHLASTREWYAERLRGLDPSTPNGRRARLAFLACEGAFALRFLQLMTFSDEAWEQVFEDLDTELG